MTQPFELITLAPYQLLCKAGEENSDLYLIQQGKLLVFVAKGSQITPIAELAAGEYLGELSFFDQRPRSAHVVALEQTILYKIDSSSLQSRFSPWLGHMARSLTSKIRHLDEVLRLRGIRKKEAGQLKPLTIEEQTTLFNLIK